MDKRDVLSCGYPDRLWFEIDKGVVRIVSPELQVSGGLSVSNYRCLCLFVEHIKTGKIVVC